MKKIAQAVAMSLMLTALFASANTPAVAGVNSLIALCPAPMPMCAPGDKNCNPGPWWPTAQEKLSPAPMPMCAPGDKNCNPGPWWPTAR